MTDFIYWLGDFFNTFFSYFEKLGNVPNYIFLALGFVLFFWWMSLQKKYNEKAEREGGLK